MRSIRWWRRSGAALTLALSLSLSAAPARADFASDAGYGALATLANLFYMPTKILYSGFGALVGGLAYVAAAGDAEAARGVWSPTMGGDYVLTGAMLRGEEPILFVGPTYQREVDVRVRSERIN